MSGQIREDRLWRVVLVGREEQALIGIELHRLRDDTELHRLHVLRTLGDNDDISTVLALDGLAQATCGQELVVDHETVIVDQQDVDARFHVTVLESIVEKDHVDLLTSLSVDELLDATGALGVDSQGDIRKLLSHLERLVANVPHGGILSCQHEAMRLALIAATEHCHVHVILQQTDEILHMRRLACATYRDVAYGDDRHLEGTALQEPHLEEEVPEADSQAVAPAQWQQFLIDIDEVAFHLSTLNSKL